MAEPDRTVILRERMALQRVCQALGVPPAVVAQYAKTGRLRFEQLYGTTYFYGEDVGNLRRERIQARQLGEPAWEGERFNPIGPARAERLGVAPAEPREFIPAPKPDHAYIPKFGGGCLVCGQRCGDWR